MATSSDTGLVVSYQMSATHAHFCIKTLVPLRRIDDEDNTQRQPSGKRSICKSAQIYRITKNGKRNSLNCGYHNDIIIHGNSFFA